MLRSLQLVPGWRHVKRGADPVAQVVVINATGLRGPALELEGRAADADEFVKGEAVRSVLLGPPPSPLRRVAICHAHTVSQKSDYWNTNILDTE